MSGWARPTTRCSTGWCFVPAAPEKLRAGRRTVELTRPEKVLFPAEGIRKVDLATYYLAVSPTMLRHVRGRPVSMERYPDGIDKPGFYEKELPDHFPEWVASGRVEVLADGRRQRQVVCDDAATLVYLADQACITPHAWLSRVDRPHVPDRLILDLDPSDGDFEKVRSVAFHARDLLQELGLPPHVMTTGSRGVHVVVALRRDWGFDAVRAFARGVAAALAKRHPTLATVETRMEARGARVFVDYLRNGYAQTAVAPYAVRARPGAPVATPIGWHELADPELHARSFTLRTVPGRLTRTGDPWSAIGAHARGLAGPAKRLAQIAP